MSDTEEICWMLAGLGAACRAAREAKGVHPINITVMAGLKSTQTIARFESGEAWPRLLPNIISAYAKLCDMDRVELWARGVEAAYALRNNRRR